MKANCWYGKTITRVEEVPDPQILNQRDAIVKITSTALSGSDLHLYNGFIPTMQRGGLRQRQRGLFVRRHVPREVDVERIDGAARLCLLADVVAVPPATADPMQ